MIRYLARVIKENGKVEEVWLWEHELPKHRVVCLIKIKVVRLEHVA